ncbi:hypothetical protein [Streptomyces sp. NPDC005438]|uniref:hypothetical protein n=1 Tax=Streptomyces sp. NPDC005438 TaxID=3156880 RepID=UPI0033BE1B34
MAQAARPRNGPWALLDTDGRRHPLQNACATLALGLGLLALITAYWHDLHLVSSWAGLVGVLVGGWGQMISVTTAERFVLVVGLGTSALGFFLGMAHGGLFGGLVG